MQDTKAMGQYYSLKKDNPDSILLFRMGDFYEMFDKDAVVASKVLNITLTSRDRTEKKTPMAGFPYHALDSYLAKLLDAGYKVAVCEQLEDPKLTKGVVKRDIVKVVTPSTSLLDNDNRESNYLLAVFKKKDFYLSSFIDFSSGDFYIHDPLSKDDFITFVSSISPKEIIVDDSFDLNIGSSSSLFPYFNKDYLFSHFKVSTSKGFGIPDIHLSLNSAGAIIKYVKDNQRNEILHIKPPKIFKSFDYMILDENCIRSLELFETYRDFSYQGSLISVIDKTSSSLGARKLRFLLSHPLLDPIEIEKRLEGVEEILKLNIGESFTENLSLVSDMYRISAKIGTLSVMPRDLLSLASSIDAIVNLLPKMKEFQSRVLKDLSNSISSQNKLFELLEVIRKYIDESSPMLLKDGGYIKKGINVELDKYKDAIEQGKSWITNFQKEEIEKLGIPSLKVHYNKVFGYYIEVSHTHKSKIPSDYIRKQTLVNAERFISPKLKEYEDLIINAQGRISTLENDIYNNLKVELQEYIPYIQFVADAVGTLDVLLSFAISAKYLNFHKPKINTDDDNMKIEGGRHPVIENVIFPDQYIPNDIEFSSDQRIIVITGPNMSGKSSILRQTAIISILAQMGSFVPAKNAVVPIIDRIFTRVGAADDLSKGESTFMVEMTETANILNNATSKSLIILDEIGRGTSTFDGVSIAWAIIEYIYERIGAKTIFATHYHELVKLEELFPKIKNFNVDVREKGGKVIFLRNLVKGGTDKSYGIYVAKISGVPDAVISRANEILKNFIEKQGGYKVSSVQNDLFSGEHYDSSIEKELHNLDINSLSPIDAFNKLLELKSKLN